MTLELKDWNTTAINNGFTPPDGYPENMNYSQVNNAAREAKAVLARHFADTNGSLVAGGTANALTLTPNGAYSALFQGMRFAFKAAFNNTAAATLTVGALAATQIVQADGDPLDEDALRTGLVYDVVYNGTAWQIVGSSALGPGFGLTNRPAESRTLVYFSAETALNSEAVLSWQAEAYDDAAVWTSAAPTVFTIPASLNGRRVRLKAQAVATSYPDNQPLSVKILKNGSETYIGAGAQRVLTDTGEPAAHAETAFIEVATGDVFRVEVPNGIGPITLARESTWFFLEVAPVSGIPTNLNFPFTFSAQGALTANETLLGPLAPVAFTIAAGLTGTQARLESAPAGGSLVISLQKNGVEFGTVTFADGSQTATLAAASATSVAIGDRLDAVVPADALTAQGLRVTVLGTYEFNG